MNKEDFNKMVARTQSQQDRYNNNTLKFIALNDVDFLKKYPYKTTPLVPPPLNPETFGITDRHFGGNVVKVARIRNSPWHILANKYDETMYLFLPLKLAKELTLAELKKICDRFSIKYEAKVTKNEVLEMLTDEFE